MVTTYKPKRPKVDTKILGSTGLNQLSGFINEEVLPELRGPRWIRTVREMIDQDAVIGAFLFAIEMLIRQVDFYMDPADENDPTAVEYEEFFQQAIFEDMDAPFKDTVSEILSMLPWGWSAFEECYKYRDFTEATAPKERQSKFTDGKIGWRKWAIRAQETLWQWDFDPITDELLGMKQLSPPHYQIVTIPLSKMLLFRTTSKKDSPEGKSILRTAYRSWFLKKKIENIEAVGIERDLAGLPIFWVPREILDNDSTDENVLSLRRDLQQMVRNVRRDSQEGMLLPQEYDDNGNKMYDFQLASTTGNRQFDTNQIIGRHNRDIAMCVLADFLIMGHQESAGSFALADNKTNLFAKAVGSWMDSICDVVNTVAIPRLMRLNAMDTALAPKLMHGDIETLDLGDLGTYIQKLALAGIPGLDSLDVTNYLFSQAKIPNISEEEFEAEQLKLEQQKEEEKQQFLQNVGAGPGKADTGGLKPGDNGYQGPNAPIVTQGANPSTRQGKKPVIKKKGAPVRLATSNKGGRFNAAS